MKSASPAADLEEVKKLLLKTDWLQSQIRIDAAGMGIWVFVLSNIL